MSDVLDILGVSLYSDVQWTKEEVEKRKKAAIAEDWAGVGGIYGVDETRVLYETLDLHRTEIKEKRVLVIGSQTPWVEAVLLAIGAKHVTTLEYNKIHSTHPQVKFFLRLISNSQASILLETEFLFKSSFCECLPIVLIYHF